MNEKYGCSQLDAINFHNTHDTLIVPKGMTLKQLVKDYDRSNNIIDELEKWLKSEISYWGEDYETLMCSDRIIYLEEVLDKLKALKEGK